ncbi:META domain-containing protein [Formosa sp. PL04]|uniref:META domain-containing protein n=1 Tax=Formosa sp. PL04 TaxID=3081755 RepID=UPI002981B6DF|nr:META domain-containing protein [Formosa sp. PL04]MDW5288853.1 META domain-containing protein [Formosa sp. PL04]
MHFLKISLVFIILITAFSCEELKNNAVNTTSTVTKSADSIVELSSTEVTKNNSIAFFKGTGSNTDWDLQLTASTIQFKLKTEDSKVYTFPLPEPILAADANVKMYKVETEAATIKIQIAMGDCIDSNSKTHPYAISIDFKPNTDTDFTSFKGCGEYITDYRLHDIWVLESINDNKVSPEQFSKELPNIEIYAKDNRFLGYAGCNTMSGSIFSEQSKIRFTQIVTTRKMCASPNNEALFLKALERSTQFKVENLRLYLSNPDGNTLTFKKVD